MLRVAVLGLGRMGSAMAANLLDKGFPVTVYNRTPEKARPLAEAGAEAAVTPAEAARSADVVITMVADDAALADVLLGDGGAMDGARAGTLFVDCSTVSPATAVRMAAEAERRGLAMLDAPVLGSVQAAAGGTLDVVVGGRAADVERARPVLEALGKAVYHLGGYGAGCAFKLAFNLMLGVQIQALAEGLVLGERYGLDRDQMLEIIMGSILSSPYLQYKSRPIATGDYRAAFTLGLLEKDLFLALEAGRQVGVSLPAAAAVHAVTLAGKSCGKEDLDSAAVYLEMRERAGLDRAGA